MSDNKAFVKVKICGLRRVEDAAPVNAAGADYAGFIFDPTRRRYIDPERAAGIIEALNPEITTVGVFVNADIPFIVDYAKRSGVKAVQLHGSESNEFIDALRREFEAASLLTAEPAKDVPSGRTAPVIIQAFRIDTADDIKKAKASHADLILLDHGIGGTGESFDWSLIRDIGREFILAGGISKDNVCEAMELTKPYGIDVSSSLETEGVKDPDKIREFIEVVRSYRACK